MANEISAFVGFTYNKNGITAQDSVTPGQALNTAALVNVAGPGIESQNPFLVPTTSGGVVIPLGGVSSPGGFLFVTNLDPTNYIMLLTAVSGTEFARILPGDPPFFFRLAPGLTAPAWQAHTAACNARYKIFDL